MSILVVQIPERQRLNARGGLAPESAASGLATEYAYVSSPDALVMSGQGEAAAALLPKAVTVIAMLADTDVSWHRITLPKAPAARLRAALVGVLEESLLTDPDDVHLAVAPGATAGQPTWVAAVDRHWLRAELAALEKANVFVDRIVPSSWPDDPPSGHFAETRVSLNGPEQGVLLHWAHADGVASIRLHGGLSRALIPRPAPAGTRWSATPGAASSAEQWLGMPVNVMSRPERALQAARSLWDLRQFDLAQRTRGARALRDGLRKFTSPQWRPVRWGLAALVVAQIVGLNLWAWHQRSTVEARQQAIRSAVRAAFPRVSDLDLQRDAAAVMQREVQALRAVAGKAGDTDFEPMLMAAASAWPPDRPPVETLRYEPGRLTLAAAGWSEQQIAQFKSLLQPAGWQVDANGTQIVLSRARAGARS
ncbi:type II secretion system protein GspL [Variovorax sp. YR752]|uniref:type II secretion system protein GspL n=1 Tax=Variovorax sp. YR752 TaxID=1884383 RepID=UPI0031377292